MEMIQTEKLVYEYEKRDEEGNVIGTSRAIDEVDIEAKEGQFIAVLGHNGSGKSTLAKHLNAILVPTEGSVWVNGKNTSNPEELWDVRQSAGMVFQNPDNQIVTDKVWHELAFGLESLGYKNAEIRIRVAEMASYFGIQDWFYKNVAELSGGQKQLLNLASIMAMHPDILILDEVLSVGDAKFRKKSEAKIMSMFDKGVTVLFVSHSLDQVKRLCNKAILLEKGQIISRGSIEEVSKVYEEKTK